MANVARLLLAIALLSTLACKEDEVPEPGYISVGQEACEPIATSEADKPEECITWACTSTPELECATTIPYGATCENWAENLGCAIEDVALVYCTECPGEIPNW